MPPAAFCFLLSTSHQTATKCKPAAPYCAWIKSKTEPPSKWKCTPCWAQPIMCRRAGLGLRGIGLSRGYLQVLALSPWLWATDQPSRVWLQPTGDEDQNQVDESVRRRTGCCAFSLQYFNGIFLYFLSLLIRSSHDWPFLSAILRISAAMSCFFFRV